MNYKTNLTKKHISEFTTDDTLYVSKIDRGYGITMLVQFIKLESWMVTGKVLHAEPNPEQYKNKIVAGWEVKSPVMNCSLWGSDVPNHHEMFHHFDAIGYAAYDSAEQRYNSVPCEHPSYGMLSIIRSQCNKNKALFGSSLLHSDSVTIVISEARLERELHQDHYYSGKSIVEVEMSPQQFLDALTQPNTSGHPVTIRNVNSQSTPPVPFISKVDQFHNEFDQAMDDARQNFSNGVGKITTILDSPKPITKAERELIRGTIREMTARLPQQLKFLAKSFSEQIESVTGEAKAAISNHAISNSVSVKALDQ